jgi:glutathione S-transferase
MSMELYWGSGSTPAWRAQLGLAVKGVPYTSRLLSFSKGETRSPAFLAVNPRGKVPTLVDGDQVVNESIAILAYLDRKHPEPPLFGETPEEAGQVWRCVMEFESHGNPAFGAVARPILFGTLEADRAKVLEALPALVHELDLLAERVAGGVLVGDRLSAADLVWFCGLQQVVRAATRPAAAPLGLGLWPLGDRWPALVPWAQRIESLPGYADTFPPHWRESNPPSPATLT